MPNGTCSFACPCPFCMYWLPWAYSFYLAFWLHFPAYFIVPLYACLSIFLVGICFRFDGLRGGNCFLQRSGISQKMNCHIWIALCIVMINLFMGELYKGTYYFLLFYFLSDVDRHKQVFVIWFPCSYCGYIFHRNFSLISSRKYHDKKLLIC